MSVRLAWPLRMAPTGQLATVEQDSDEDIAQCVRLILLHRDGDRTDLPELAVPDLAHSEQPLDLDGLVEIVERHEPRVTILAAQRPDLLDELLVEVELEWRRQHTDRDPEA